MKRLKVCASGGGRAERAHGLEGRGDVGGDERGRAVGIAAGIDSLERLGDARHERGLCLGEGGRSLDALARRGGLRVVEQAREVVEDAGRALLGVPTGVRDDQQEAARASEGALRMQQAGERVEVRRDGVGGLA